MRIWQACFIVAVCGWIVGCDESNNRITDPTVIDVGGVWVGDATLTSASGAGCAGENLDSLAGLTYPLSIELEQSAFLVSGLQVSGLPIEGGDGLNCDLSGSVTDTGFELASSSCDVDPIEDAACFDGSLRDLTLVSVSIRATVDGDRAIGDTTSSWETTDSQTGASTGTLTVNADFSLDR